MVLRVRLREVHSHLHSLRGQRRHGRHADVGGSAAPATVQEISASAASHPEIFIPPGIMSLFITPFF